MRFTGYLHADAFTGYDAIFLGPHNRMTAGCHDACHVTGNRAKPVFDSCDTSGLGDNDYNLCAIGTRRGAGRPAVTAGTSRRQLLDAQQE